MTKFIRIYRFFVVVAIVIGSLWTGSLSQPMPGDVFREYCWYKTDGDAGGSLRVGGREGTTNWGTLIIDGFWETQNIALPHLIDLDHAVKAEINIEKILCHDGTQGLGIQLNGNDWISIPEADGIPAPQWEYQHHIYPTIPVPLTYLKQGVNNSFKMRVSAQHTWNWPQNLIYGVHIRIYYDPSKKPHPKGAIANLVDGQEIGRRVNLKVAASSTNGVIRKVDFIGLYEDVNFEGDGIYRQWHYHFFHGDLLHHIGSVTKEPFELTWNTDWIPDQPEPLQLAARIHDQSGMIYFTKAVQGLDLVRPGYSVELCKPYEVPPQWVTRKAEHSEKFQIKGDVRKATAYQLVWASWSPGYMNGVYVNDRKVFDSEGPRYAYYAHRVTLTDVSPLKTGENVLKTGKTPKIDGKMVHGMEVEWPGIMVLVQYDLTSRVGALPQKSEGLERLGVYPNPFNPATTIRYFLPRSGDVALRIFSPLGEQVATLVQQSQPSGAHSIPWTGCDRNGIPVGSGVYYCQLSFNNHYKSEKMLLIK